MTVTINGDSGITTTGLTTTGNNTLGDASTDTLNVGNGGLVKDASGNVGIGTGSPNSNSGYTVLTLNNASNGGMLDLNANGTRVGTMFATSAGGYAGTVTATPMQFLTNGSERMRIDSSGNVGIGTNAPSVKLNVSDGTVGMQMNPSGGVGYYGTITNHPAVISTNGSERMRIDTSGNVQIGMTGGTNRLNIKYTDNNQLLLDNDGSTSTGMTYSNNGTVKVQCYWHNSLARYYISAVSAGVYLASGGTSWTSASDERVKDIIEPIENATEKLVSWRTVIGKYKTDEEGTRRSFLIAQDVLQTFPEAVDSTNEEELGVRYQDTIPLLVKAIQEQQDIINTLTSRIEALENK